MPTPEHAQQPPDRTPQPARTVPLTDRAYVYLRDLPTFQTRRGAV